MSEKRTLPEQLRNMAAVSSDVRDFKIELRGRLIHVSHASGSTEWLLISMLFPSPTGGGGSLHGSGSPHRSGTKKRVKAERPLLLRLRRETKGDARGKAMRINREVELGDAAFDEQIYIDTPSDERVVRAVLADSEARATALELLQKDVRSIEIDNEAGFISFSIIEFRRFEEDMTRVHRILDAVMRLVDALPEVIASPTKRPPDLFSRVFLWGCGLALLGFVVVLFSYAPLSPRLCIVHSFVRDESDFVCSVSPDCCSPAYLGLGAGTIASALFAAIFFFTIRGKSNSHLQMIGAIIVTSILCLELGIFIARLAW